MSSPQPDNQPDVTRDIALRAADSLTALRDRIVLKAAGRPGIRDRRWATRWLSLFWSVAIGVIAALLPLSVLAVVLPAEDVPAGAMLALVIVALVAYISDWKAGIAAMTMSAVVLSRWADKDAGSEPSPALRILLLGLAIGGAAILLVIERLKTEGSIDRQETLAARSAATALAAVETVAATQNLSPEVRTQLHHAIVRSIAGVNRAHAAALLLVDPQTGDLEPAALYGFGSDADDYLRADADSDGFAARVRAERRTLQISGIQRSSGKRYDSLRRTRVKSLLGSPIISRDETTLGVIVVGLLVDHRFTSREVRRLDALASQVASILETMDVMDRREIQLQQARDEQRRLEQVIAAVPEAIIISAPATGSIIAMNQAAQKLFHSLDPEAILAAIHPVDQESSTLSPTERALTFGESVNDVECVIEIALGSPVPVLASAALVRDDGGEVVAIVSAFRDISALKEASRLKDEFVSVVSHELRSPLTPVRGFVQLVARELSREGGHDVQVKRLESVSGHVDRLTRLVDDLLDVSRLRSGTLEIRPVDSDLVALCHLVAESWTGGPSPADVVFETDLENLHGTWDPDRIHQVLDNLIINAVKYGQPGVRITLSLAQDGDSATIAVADDGPGIDEGLKEEIFGAFYRTPSARIGQVQGLGLGLYICQALVEAHGGQIELVPDVEAGSVFIIRLPVSTTGTAIDATESDAIAESVMNPDDHVSATVVLPDATASAVSE